MPKKVDGYDRERLDTLKKYLEILGINENNKEICLNEIDKDEDKLRRLEEMDSEIRKYYLTGKWTSYQNKNMKRKYYSVLKYMLKDCEKEYEEKSETKIIRNGRTSTSETIKRIEIK